MSDTTSPVGSGNGSSPQFTERELQILGWALQSLKSGPPDVCTYPRTALHRSH
jgi:hypothetical protein